MSSSPFEGASDTDQNDTYPGVIKGLVYASGDIMINHDAVLEGVLVAGDEIIMNDNVDLTHQRSIETSPPPGFRNGDIVRIAPGTWKTEWSE